LAWPSLRIQTSKRKGDGQTGEQEEDCRPKARFFTIKSCFTCLHAPALPQPPPAMVVHPAGKKLNKAD